MENKQERFQSHEEREVQKLVKRLENTQASQEAAREGDTKRTFDDYEKKVEQLNGPSKDTRRVGFLFSQDC
jgi:hypothetical protein